MIAGAQVEACNCPLQADAGFTLHLVKPNGMMDLEATADLLL